MSVTCGWLSASNWLETLRSESRKSEEQRVLGTRPAWWPWGPWRGGGVPWASRRREPAPQFSFLGLFPRALRPGDAPWQKSLTRRTSYFILVTTDGHRVFPRAVGVTPGPVWSPGIGRFCSENTLHAVSARVSASLDQEGLSWLLDLPNNHRMPPMGQVFSSCLVKK